MIHWIQERYNLWCNLGPVHKGANPILKAAIRFLIGFVIWTMCVHKHCKRRPIMNRICALQDNILFLLCRSINQCMASARISKMPMHKTRSERALRSQVLRIRLSRHITIQNALFFTFQKLDLKAWFGRALSSQREKSGFQIRKGSASWSKMAFGLWFAPLWTGPWRIRSSTWSEMVYIWETWQEKKKCYKFID